MLGAKSCESKAEGLETFGIQLYSVRDVFEKDPQRTIRALANMGYRQLESYERNNDMFWGMGPKGFSQLMNELEISLLSSHCEVEKDFDRKVAQAAEAGMKYLVHNWPYAPQPMDEYLRKAELYNRCGELCRKAGIRFAYHNYSSSYQLLNGIYPQELLMERTDPSLVYHQMDIYWVWKAGQDPVYWLKKFPGRYQLAHVKDGNNKETTLLGRGRVPLRKIITSAKEAGMGYFLVEQEHYQGESSMEAAGRNAKWMRDA
jgi:sugar phosphate isomerase/epimerase